MVFVFVRVYTHASLRAKTERVAKAISYRSWSLQVRATNIKRQRETKPHKIMKVKSTIVVCTVYYALFIKMHACLKRCKIGMLWTVVARRRLDARFGV